MAAGASSKRGQDTPPSFFYVVAWIDKGGTAVPVSPNLANITPPFHLHLRDVLFLQYSLVKGSQKRLDTLVKEARVYHRGVGR